MDAADFARRKRGVPVSAPETPLGALPWRVGSQVGRTIYDAGNRILGLLDTRELARQAVDAVNERAGLAPEREGILLEWNCQTCGMREVLPAPGFIGDGYRHFDGRPGRGCGPLIAYRVGGWLRLRPGAPREEIAATLAKAAAEKP
jgi:hypothetical protein